MIDTNELREKLEHADYKETVSIAEFWMPKLLDNIDQLRTTLQHATEDKAKTLAILQQLHMKRADPHNTQELLEFYLEAHLLIRNLLNGVPMPSEGLIPDIRRRMGGDEQ